MLIVSYDPVLVIASVLVAVMAAYTGLRLASGLSQLDAVTRKQEIAKAATALGGGIWSMHFIGMLAVQIPVPIRYDALATLGSVLVAILVTGLGLLVLHSGPRTRRRICFAGTLTGLGIVSMHYIGMSAIGGNCIVVYKPAGYVISTAIAIAASIAALWLAYSRRTKLQIALGSVLLGITIASMHYSAMIYTRFLPTTEILLLEEPNLSSGMLALVVAFAAFLICGLFLLTAIPARAVNSALEPVPDLGTSHPPQSPQTGPPMPAVDLPAVAAVPVGAVFTPAGAAADTARDMTVPPSRNGQVEKDPPPSRLPYEVNHATRFIAIEEIYAVRADGHYTKLYNDQGEVLCPWPISRVETALNAGAFIRTHRSYLVNLHHVRGFERIGDKAYCLIGDDSDAKVPVSRSRLQDVRQALGLR
ncbi:MHYT domain-containing protein [Algihabitans albus]|uniref:MHYT domain-containing protein n=1 Tax=Algihabitans albus TaxID=2164067 RepID=UPI000E5CDE6D|nr:MHYT domain-containing protein [Algihabitans albus]